MWIMLNDAFFSIVKKDSAPGELLVRARRPGDIEKVFGRRFPVTRLTDADYLFRASVPVSDVEAIIGKEINRISYSNFKNSVKDNDLHHAYLKVWSAMAACQDPPPYSDRFSIFPEDRPPVARKKRDRKSKAAKNAEGDIKGTF